MPGLGIGFGTLGAPAVRARRVGFDFGAGLLPAGATLTRASAGYGGDATGAVRPFGPDIARFDYRRVGQVWQAAGLLLEPAATNLMLHSQAIATDPVWAGFGGATVTASAIAAPDGGSGAVRAAIVTGSLWYQQLWGLTPDAPYSVSIYARRPAEGGASHLRITTNNQTGWASGASAKFALSDSWQRLVMSGPVSDRAGASIGVGAIDASGVGDPDCAGAVELWQAQCEQGEIATSAIATGAATASRAADALVLDWGALGVADGSRAAEILFGDGSRAATTMTVAGGRAALGPVAGHPAVRRIRAL